MYFDQILDFQILLLLFLHTLLLCHILLFGCWIFSIPSRCQTVWTQIRPKILSGPDLDPNCLQGLSADIKLSGWILVQTVCKGYQQKTKVGKELNTKKLVDTTFWLKPLLKLKSFGYNFFHLAKVLATTNSEPDLALAMNIIIKLYGESQGTSVLLFLDI